MLTKNKLKASISSMTLLTMLLVLFLLACGGGRPARPTPPTSHFATKNRAIPAINKSLVGFEPTAWDSEGWNIKDWRRE